MFLLARMVFSLCFILVLNVPVWADGIGQLRFLAAGYNSDSREDLLKTYLALYGASPETSRHALLPDTDDALAFADDIATTGTIVGDLGVALYIMRRKHPEAQLALRTPTVRHEIALIQSVASNCEWINGLEQFPAWSASEDLVALLLAAAEGQVARQDVIVEIESWLAVNQLTHRDQAIVLNLLAFGNAPAESYHSIASIEGRLPMSHFISLSGHYMDSSGLYFYLDDRLETLRQLGYTMEDTQRQDIASAATVIYRSRNNYTIQRFCERLVVEGFGSFHNYEDVVVQVLREGDASARKALETRVKRIRAAYEPELRK